MTDIPSVAKNSIPKNHPKDIPWNKNCMATYIIFAGGSLSLHVNLRDEETKL